MVVQETFYLWLMKDLRPSHNQNSQNRKKTGKNREFLQKTVFLGNFYTTYDRTRPQIFGIFYPIPHKNSLQKQQGIFWNISGNYQRISGNFIPFQR